jgi:hypothetical protein
MTPSLFVIRRSQRQVLADDLVQRWVVRCLAETYTDLVHERGMPWLETLANDSIAKARRQGYRTPMELRKFVHVALLAGVDFDRLPWARRVIASRFYRQPLARLRALEDAAIKALGSAPVR